MNKTSILKLLFCLSIIFTFSFSLSAQNAEKAIGIRGGLSSGFEYRVFSSPSTSYKVLFSTRNHGVQLTGLKEFHTPEAFSIDPNLTFIYGFGAHLGIESWYSYEYYDIFDKKSMFRERRSGPIVGLDALAGMEYSIPQIPLIAGFEYKPYFNLLGKNFLNIQPFDFAFTLKYTF